MSQRLWVLCTIILLSGCDPKKPELCDGNSCVEVDPNCVAEAEVCDGLDNDCNGQVDDLEPIDCTSGVGACLANGVERCENGAWAECDAASADPLVEVCDAVDNDCDGQTDEALEPTPCTDGIGECLANGQQHCVDGDWACDAVPGDPVAEICDGLDNDCNGQTDDGIAPVACREGIGACQDDGVQRCVGGELAACDATPGMPMDEICDGFDNDCDGETDEETNFACIKGLGACAREGRFDCVAGVASCSAVPGMPAAEICSGMDEDCDGRVDESFPEEDTSCAEGVGECRAEGMMICQNGQTNCSARPTRPSREICDNDKDEDCDGDTDEGNEADPHNCGGCGIVCDLPHAIAGCPASECTVRDCLSGWQNLDGDPTNGCECRPGEEDLPDPEGFDANCDGIDGDLNQAVFVSNTHGRANGLGNAADPIDRLQTAIQVAVNADLPIYLAQGDYIMAESLQIPSGVRIYGGFQYTPAEGWSRDRSLNSVIRGVSPVILYPDTLNTPTRLDTVHVIADDAANGLSSVAIRVVDGGNNLTISGVTIQAGRGGAGTDGMDGPRIFPESVRGNAGEAGDEFICNGCGGFGGLNLNNFDTQGGSGGNAGSPGFDGATPGLHVATGGAAGVNGGAGEPGGDGTKSADGSSSEPGDPNGMLNAQTGLWTPYWTGDGGPSIVGGGGGGGGGGAGQGGGGGGGGGTGGMSGNPGTGALGGGGSFCLQVEAGQVTIELSELITTGGGRGGNGGNGSLGEYGARGGEGGAVALGCDNCGPGGHGGRGGDGSCGGHAGGAAGGSSIAVLLVGDAQVVWPGEPMLGPAGVGGAGGADMRCQIVAASNGSDGYRLPIARCTLGDDGACVTLAAAAPR